ncbi:MAG: hypothetical protein ISS52_04725 [Dehalococcoidia bacterium]|nr:hypothetical protein [Dehalococcoidia bacterium]
MWGNVLFVGLNLLDAWLTKQAFALGEVELNPVVSFFGYGDNLLLKGLLALVIALILWGLGKSYLSWYLNVLMLGVIWWNLAVLTLLTVYW